jgi:hypothetical protein
MRTGGRSELQGLERLLILLLVQLGTSATEIGPALDVDSSLIRRTFPVRDIKEFKGIR